MQPNRIGLRLDRFVRAEGGNFAIIFALTLFPVIAISGLSLDYARIRHAQQRLQSAVDVAALAAAGATGRPDAQLQQLVIDFVEANSGGYAIDVNTSIDSYRLTVEASTLVPTPLLSVVSSPQTQVSFTATVVRGKSQSGGSVGAGAPGELDDGEENARKNFLRSLNKLPRHVRDRLERKYEAMLPAPRLAR